MVNGRPAGSSLVDTLPGAARHGLLGDLFPLEIPSRQGVARRFVTVSAEQVETTRLRTWPQVRSGSKALCGLRGPHEKPTSQFVCADEARVLDT